MYFWSKRETILKVCLIYTDFVYLRENQTHKWIKFWSIWRYVTLRIRVGIVLHRGVTLGDPSTYLWLCKITTRRKDFTGKWPILWLRVKEVDVYPMIFLFVFFSLSLSLFTISLWIRRSKFFLCQVDFNSHWPRRLYSLGKSLSFLLDRESLW